MKTDEGTLKDHTRAWLKTGILFLLVNSIVCSIVLFVDIHWLRMTAMWISIPFNFGVFGYSMAGISSLIEDFYNDEL